METFKKTNSVRVATDAKSGATIFVAETNFPHSLVLFKDRPNEAGVCTTYEVMSRCRKTDTKTVLKALIRAVLAMAREYNKVNFTTAARISGKTAYNQMRSAMNCNCIGVTNSDGFLLSGAVLTVPDGLTLNKAFGVGKTKDLYKLVVEEGREWDDPVVAAQLTCWVHAAIDQANVGRYVDLALTRAAVAACKETADVQEELVEAQRMLVDALAKVAEYEAAEAAAEEAVAAEAAAEEAVAAEAAAEEAVAEEAVAE